MWRMDVVSERLKHHGEVITSNMRPTNADSILAALYWKDEFIYAGWGSSSEMAMDNLYELYKNKLWTTCKEIGAGKQIYPGMVWKNTR